MSFYSYDQSVWKWQNNLILYLSTYMYVYQLDILLSNSRFIFQWYTIESISADENECKHEDKKLCLLIYNSLIFDKNLKISRNKNIQIKTFNSLWIIFGNKNHQLAESKPNWIGWSVLSKLLTWKFFIHDYINYQTFKPQKYQCWQISYYYYILL